MSATEVEKSSQDVIDQELNWFEFETRMRKMMTDQMTPSLKKLTEEAEITAALQAKYNHMKEVVDKLEVVVLKSDRKADAFDLIYQKIEQND